MKSVLMNELNSGYFDEISWKACSIMAKDAGCDCIAAQLDRYIEHYSKLLIENQSK
jgi:hypothetical protein